MLIVVRENKADQVILHQNEIHTFVDKEIVKYKAQKGIACFYKVPKLSLIHIPSPRDGLLSRMPSSA